jgi:phosphoribosylformimino-5-aminoimidazole carboxamide ribotide isomerase
MGRRDKPGGSVEYTAMRLIPVLDLKGGLVVRGVGGRRDEYRPVQSQIARSAGPIDVAVSLRETFGFREFYIADLDAIAGGAPHEGVIRELVRRDLRLLVDAGLRDVATGRAQLDAGVTRVVAALETSPGPQHLRSLLDDFGPDRVTFSLDMKAGALLTAGDGWLSPVAAGLPTAPPAGPQVSQSTTGATGSASAAPNIAGRVLECGVRSLIVLDLAGVGEGRGVPTLDLCRAVRAMSPDVELITGGGVRHADDLEALEAAGVNGVLIASALHDGSLTPAMCAQWRR